jgi:hypothetical protein
MPASQEPQRPARPHLCDALPEEKNDVTVSCVTRGGAELPLLVGGACQS